MESIVAAANDLLAEGQGFVLATIIDCEGSTPRPMGTRMLITAQQKIVGTIGGGLLEARTMRAAARMHGEGSRGRFLTCDLTNEDAATMGMICGGCVQVLLDPIRPDDENRDLFASWHKALSQGHHASLVSVVSVSEDETRIASIDHALIDASSGSAKSCRQTESKTNRLADALESASHEKGRFNLSDTVRETLSALVKKARHVHVLNLKGCLVVVDPGQIAPTLYIFGAGHVARPTAHLASMVGFGVVVLDDRPEFADRKHFPDATAVHTLSSFNAAFNHLAVTTDTYIVIVTRGHLHDREVLVQALKTPAAYIGMIGSRHKRDAMYESLLKDGYKDAHINRVHCPIGLPIGGDTPEEIAVSIVAELISVRSKVRFP
jgi:xanthine dehydrogenase accessory factor